MNVININESANITCTGVNSTATITPVLPTGLRYSKGAIIGVPLEPSPFITYTISSISDIDTFVLGGIVGVIV